MLEPVLGVVTAAGLLVFVGAVWFGAALVVRGGYRWAYRSTSSRAMAVGAGAAGSIVGVLGGWVVADIRAILRARGRSAWLVAVAAWLASTAVSATVAMSVAEYPQPGQRIWVLMLGSLPAVPLLATLIAVAVVRVRGRRSPWASKRVPQVLFWTSVAVLALVIPKPN